MLEIPAQALHGARVRMQLATPGDRTVQARDDLTRTWTELGSYKGNAPTVREAMDAAKQMCGSYGADLFILNAPPFASEGVFKVDGICAATTKATAKR